MVQTHGKLFIKNPIHIDKIKSPILIIDNIKIQFTLAISKTQFTLAIYQKPNSY